MTPNDNFEQLERDEELEQIQKECEADFADDIPEAEAPTEEEVRQAIADIQGSVGSRYLEFTFPLAVSGIDPDDDTKELTKIIYPTLKFKEPSSGRDVRRAIKKFIRNRFNQKPTKDDLWNMFNLGIEYMYRLRVEAQIALNKADGSVSERIIATAQAHSEKLYEQTKDKENLV